MAPPCRKPIGPPAPPGHGIALRSKGSSNLVSDSTMAGPETSDAPEVEKTAQPPPAWEQALAAVHEALRDFSTRMATYESRPPLSLPLALAPGILGHPASIADAASVSSHVPITSAMPILQLPPKRPPLQLPQLPPLYLIPQGLHLIHPTTLTSLTTQCHTSSFLTRLLMLMPWLP
jgi:hypothetical protein